VISLVGASGQVGKKLFKFYNTVSVAVKFLKKSFEVRGGNLHLQLHKESVQLTGTQISTLINVKFSKHVAQDVLVALTDTHVEELVADSLGQMFKLLLSYGRRGVFYNLPNRLEHGYEIIVFNNGHTQVSVVIAPHIPGNLLYLLAVDAEAIKELSHDLFFSVFSINGVLVAANIISST